MWIPLLHTPMGYIKGAICWHGDAKTMAVEKLIQAANSYLDPL